MKTATYKKEDVVVKVRIKDGMAKVLEDNKVIFNGFESTLNKWWTQKYSKENKLEKVERKKSTKKS